MKLEEENDMGIQQEWDRLIKNSIRIKIPDDKIIDQMEIGDKTHTEAELAPPQASSPSENTEIFSNM